MTERTPAPLPPPADLAACDREPIRVPGSVQPHGAMLVVADPDLAVTHASANAAALLGVDRVLGRTPDDLLGVPLADALRADAPDPAARYLRTVPVGPDRRPFHVLAHRHAGNLFVELEPAGEGGLETFADLYALVGAFTARLQAAAGVNDLCHLVAEEVRRLTGFDRALVYRFDDGWNGTTVAEDRNDTLPAYLDLRFPASDIPAPARDLYRLNRVRLIADAAYRPAPIEPPADPPLDLTYSTLRSVSPVHVEYMRNMGTAASLSVSVVRDGRLWGLISCHHHAAKLVPFPVRAACDSLAQVFALRLAAVEAAAGYERRLALRAVQAELLAQMAAEKDFADGLLRDPALILRFAAAGGALVTDGGRCRMVGRCPPEADVLALAGWLAGTGRADVFHTDALPAAYPPAGAWADRASGVLAVSVSKLHPAYVLWFRPEVVRTVKWAGDPRKPVAGDERISPRKSFDAWKETVRGRSLPWTVEEVEAAAELRNAIVGIVLRAAEERAELVGELQRSNTELEAFSYSVSHDLRAPLRHIAGYAELLREAAGGAFTPDQARHLNTIVESAANAGQLVDDLLAYSKMGRLALDRRPVDMGQLVAEARRQFAVEERGRVVRWDVGPLPVVNGDLTLLRVAVNNLLSNALKYTRGRDPATIAVAAREAAGEVVVSVADNGVGFDPAYADKLFGVFERLHRMEDFEGTGIGLANVRRVAERHGGRAWAEGAVGRGATFHFTVPTAPPPHRG